MNHQCDDSGVHQPTFARWRPSARVDGVGRETGGAEANPQGIARSHIEAGRVKWNGNGLSGIGRSVNPPISLGKVIDSAVGINF